MFRGFGLGSHKHVASAVAPLDVAGVRHGHSPPCLFLAGVRQAQSRSGHKSCHNHNSG